MDGATIRGAAATVCGQRVTDWQGATGHRRDRAEVHQGKPADAIEEQADDAALVAIVDPANADARQPRSKKKRFRPEHGGSAHKQNNQSKKIRRRQRRNLADVPNRRNTSAEPPSEGEWH